MINEKKDIIICIENRGIRLTHQRRAIINILIANKKQHLSAAELYDLLKKKDKSIGLATIYRTMELLEKEGIVIRRDFESDIARYEIVINQLEHNHLICKKCGKIIEIPDMLSDNVNEKLLNENNFRYLNHSIKFYGYCKECQDK